MVRTNGSWGDGHLVAPLVAMWPELMVLLLVFKAAPIVVILMVNDGLECLLMVNGGY